MVTTTIFLNMINGQPQRLNQVLPEIPTNVILNKTITDKILPGKAKDEESDFLMDNDIIISSVSKVISGYKSSKKSSILSSSKFLMRSC